MPAAPSTPSPTHAEPLPICIAAALSAEATDMALSEYLLEKAGVAVVPGSAFGAEGYFRISFATSMKNLEMALERIQKALE